MSQQPELDLGLPPRRETPLWRQAIERTVAAEMQAVAEAIARYRLRQRQARLKP